MNYLRIILCHILLWLTSIPLSAQVINFDHIGLKEGLSQVSAMSIAQDTLGHIWIGTSNGLNQYDGSHVTNYLTYKNNENTILENQIKKIRTRRNKVWVQTPNALSYFDVNSERFTNFEIQKINTFELHQRRILIATDEGLYHLDPDSKKLTDTNIKLDKQEKISIIESTPAGLYIATNKALYILLPTYKLIPLFQHQDITCVYSDTKKNTWIGTYADGLYRMTSNAETRHFDGKQDLINGYVRCVTEDNDGNIWVGTFLGLDKINTDDSIEHHQYDKNLKNGLSHNSIWSLFKDQDGAIWAGTYYGGVNIFQPTNRLFNYYPESNKNNQSLNFRVVGRIVEDKKSNLWICTDGGGLNYLDRAESKFEYFVHRESNSISHNNTKAVLIQGDTLLWISTHQGGLNQFDLNHKIFTNYLDKKHNPENLQINDVSTIIPYQGKLLISSVDGVLQFNPKTEIFSNFFDSLINNQIKNRVIDIYIDTKNRLWVGTEYSGLFSYNLETEKLKHYVNTKNERSLTHNFVHKIFEDHFQRIWIATDDGLNLYQPETDDFSTYHTSEGFLGNIILNMIESRYGGLILATNKGISFFNPNDRTFRNITADNGLPLSELHEGGLYMARDGEIFISGIDGMASFNEKNYLLRAPTTYPQITRLEVNNKVVIPNDENAILSKNISQTEKIEVEHFQSSFSLTFSDVAYTKSSKQALEYRLGDTDTDWIPAFNQNKASYTNLEAGNYEFLVRNINNPELITRLLIAVKPALHLSWQAYLVYFLLSLITILLINRQYLIKKRLRQEVEMTRVQLDQDTELNKSKLRFFTNISHEFRTPLTLISGQADSLLEHQNLGSTTYRKILSIHKNTSRLTNLVSELLDFRKQDQGHLKIKASRNDIIPFLKEIYFSFFELSKHMNINYQFIHEQASTTHIWFDIYQMEKVFYNLLSNAFKFTEENGQILVTVKEEGGMLSIEILNTGIGIPTANIDKIFDRFYQIDNISDQQTPGTGIGLALSKGIINAHKGELMVKSQINKETIFTVSLPLGSTHFSEEEIQREEHSAPIFIDKIEVPKTTIDPNQKRDLILFVEDNKEVRSLLVELLSPLYDVKLASDGLKGLQKAIEIQPTLILSDVLMPNMTGTEMCTKLKTNLNTSHIPIILITARSASEHKIEGLETGADDYITKPFNTKILIARINNIINNRRSLHDKFAKNPSDVKKIAKNKIDQEFMEKAHDLIMNNIKNSKYNVASFSRDLNLGRTNLFAKIKGITGQTPNEFIITIRLNRSVQLISNHPDFTIAEIAYECGFSTPHYFSRIFKKHFGMSPSQYGNE